MGLRDAVMGDAVFWFSGWLTGWAAPHWAVRSSVQHAWARCPECAKSPPLPRHHALSATITRARTEPHSTGGWRRRETRTATHETQQHIYHRATYQTYTHTPFPSHTEVWYSAEGSDWLIKGPIVCWERNEMKSFWLRCQRAHVLSATDKPQ